MPKKKIAIVASLTLFAIIILIIVIAGFIGNSGKKITAIMPNETAIVPQSREITANNFEQLSEQASWGNGQVLHAALSADGKYVAIASSRGAYVFDTITGQLVYTLKQNEWINAADFSADGSMVAIGSEDGLVTVFSMTDGNVKTEFDVSYSVQEIKFSPDNEMIAAGTSSSGKFLWNLKTGKELIDGKWGKTIVESVAFSPDGAMVAFGAADNEDEHKNNLYIWEISSQKYNSSIKVYDLISDLQFSPDSKTLAVTADRDIRFYYMPDGHIEMEDDDYVNNDYITTWEFPDDDEKYIYINVQSLAYSPNGKELACGYSNGDIRFFSVKNGKVNKTISDLMIAVNALEYAADGKNLIVTSADNVTRIINANNHKITARYGGFSGQITSMAFSPDGSLLASAGSDGSIIIRQTSDGQILQRLAGHTKIVRGVTFSREGDYLFSTSADKTVIKWRVSDGKLMKVMDEYDTGFIAIATLPDGFLLGDIPLVVTSSYDGAFEQWGVPKGNLIRILESPNRLYWANDLAFSPDGAILAGGMSDGSLQLWQPITGKLIGNAQFHKNAIISLAFTSDSSIVATGSTDNSIKFWKFNQISTPIYLESHGDDVINLAFIDNDQYLLSAARNGEIYLWDYNNRKRIARLENAFGNINSICISPDGTRLAIAIPDGTVRVWSVPQ